MHRYSRLLGITGWIISIFLFLPKPLFGNEKQPLKAPVSIKAEVDKKVINIGEKINYKIEVTAGKNTEIETAVFSQTLGGLTIKDTRTSKRVFFAAAKIKYKYILTAYKNGEYIIPKITVKYKERNQNIWQKTETEEIKIKVESLFGAGKPPLDVRDIKKPVRIPGRRLFWAGFFAAVVLVVLLFLRFMFVKKESAEKTIPARPAHEIALEALEDLKRKNFIERKEIKKYYVGLSDIIRHYLENRFSIRAPEMTTEEFLIKVKQSKLLSSQHKSLLKDFLFHCDLVKFAKYGPSLEEMNSVFDSAKQLVEQTKEVEMVS